MRRFEAVVVSGVLLVTASDNDSYQWLQVWMPAGYDFTIESRWQHPKHWLDENRTWGVPLEGDPTWVEQIAIGEPFRVYAPCGPVEVHVGVDGPAGEFFWGGPCDVNIDGTVDVIDLLDFITDWFLATEPDIRGLLDWLNEWMEQW